MSEAVSKRVENQFRYARLVADTVAATKEEMKQALKEKLGAPGAEHILGGLQAVVKKLGETREAYEQALDKVGAEESEDAALRESLLREQADVSETLRDTRNALVAGFGDGALSTYSMNQVPPESREGLARYGRAVLERLNGSPRKETNALGIEVDTAPIMAHLTARFEAFTEAYEALGADAKQTEQGRLTRDRAEERFRDVLVHGAHILEGGFEARRARVHGRPRPPHARSRPGLRGGRGGHGSRSRRHLGASCRRGRREAGMIPFPGRE